MDLLLSNFYMHPRIVEKWKLEGMKSTILQRADLTMLEALNIVNSNYRMEVRTILHKKLKNDSTK